jgi:hypothetical protein
MQFSGRRGTDGMLLARCQSLSGTCSQFPAGFRQELVPGLHRTLLRPRRVLLWLRHPTHQGRPRKDLSLLSRVLGLLPNKECSATENVFPSDGFSRGTQPESPGKNHGGEPYHSARTRVPQPPSSSSLRGKENRQSPTRAPDLVPLQSSPCRHAAGASWGGFDEGIFFLARVFKLCL